MLTALNVIDFRLIRSELVFFADLMTWFEWSRQPSVVLEQSIAHSGVILYINFHL